MFSASGIVRGYLPILVMLAVLPTTQAKQEAVVIGAFSRGDLSAWEPKTFKGATDYRLVNIDNRKVLKATSNGSASGLVKRVRVDLTRTPIFAWSWRVEDGLQTTNERSKAGDDYAARIYVIVSGGIFFWKTRSLNYVWSSHQPVSSTWSNPYTANVVMVAATSGSHPVGKWVTVKRDVRADFRRYFDDDINAIDAVAVMTDTDNTTGRAVAYYGDIYFEPVSGQESGGRAYRD